MEGIDEYIDKGKSDMNDAIDHLQRELLKVRTGKASPSMLSGVLVDYYGAKTPLAQVANVSASDARTINIQPWEKSMLAVIEKAIFEANLGITPMNDGETVRLSIPPLTEDRRRDLVKQCKALGEDGKVSLRNTRHKLMDYIKKEVKDGYPEDAGKKKEDEVQNLVNSFGKRIDEIIASKEKDIMTV